MSPRFGLNILVDDAFRVAAEPLFSDGQVEVVECDIDAAWNYGVERIRLPRWHQQILDLYAEADALYGHGVWFSLLSARLEPRQVKWLRFLSRECKRRSYRHVSEHFGFITVGPFVEGTMFMVPRSDAAVRVGIDRLKRIADASGVAVGIENSPVCYAPQDATGQGAFIREILEGADGFLLLDLHNVETQAINLGLSARRLLSTYPLDRVREIHVSGGGWLLRSAARRSGTTTLERDERVLRTDTHDGRVPESVLQLLQEALPRCPNLEAVIFERRGGTLSSEEEIAEYRDDFARVRRIVKGG